MDIAGLEDRMIAATIVMDKHVSSHRRLHSCFSHWICVSTLINAST